MYSHQQQLHYIFKFTFYLHLIYICNLNFIHNFKLKICCQKKNMQNYLKKFIHRTFTFHIQILHSQIFRRTHLFSGLTMVEIHSRFLFGNTSSNPSINGIKKSSKGNKIAVKPWLFHAAISPVFLQSVESLIVRETVHC